MGHVGVKEISPVLMNQEISFSAVAVVFFYFFFLVRKGGTFSIFKRSSLNILNQLE